MNLEKLQNDYQNEVSSFQLTNRPLKEYLSSFEKYIEVMRKIDTLFSDNDKMKELRF